MEYKSAFVESFLGKWVDKRHTTIKCPNCKQKLLLPIDKGNLRVKCPKCDYVFYYSPHILFKKCLGFPVLLIGGGLSGLLVAYLNHFYDITSFYLFFIIPVGAIVLGLAANIGFIFILSFLRIKGINYSTLLLILMSGMIALFSFWLSQYIVYSTGTIPVNYVSRVPPPEIKKEQVKIKQMENTLHSLHSSIESSSDKLQRIKSIINQIEEKAKMGLVIDKHKDETLISQYNTLVSKHNINVKKAQELQSRYETKLSEVNALIDKFNRGEVGQKVVETKKEPIYKAYTFINYIKKTYEKRSFRMFGLIGKVPLVTPSVDIKLGLFGLILLLLKQIGLFFALSILWFFGK